MARNPQNPMYNASGKRDPAAGNAIIAADKAVKRLKATESQEQERLIGWTKLNKKRLPGVERLFHIPNGGHRHVRVAVKLKAEGVQAGVPDLFLAMSKHGYHGLFIELKAVGGRISELQADWLGWLKSQGYYAIACYGCDEAIKVIEWYLGG